MPREVEGLVGQSVVNLGVTEALLALRASPGRFGPTGAELSSIEKGKAPNWEARSSDSPGVGRRPDDRPARSPGLALCPIGPHKGGFLQQPLRTAIQEEGPVTLWVPAQGFVTDYLLYWQYVTQWHAGHWWWHAICYLL